MHLAQRSFYNASIQYLLSLLVLIKVIGLLLLVRSTAIEHIACYDIKIVHSRRGCAAEAVAAAGVCIVGRWSSTAPAATTVDGDAVAVQSMLCSRPNYAGQRGSNA